MSNSPHEKELSQVYQSLNQGIEPPDKVDDYIRNAAAESLSSRVASKNKLLWSLSVAASIVIVAGVVLKMAVFSNDTAVYTSSSNKQPMYLLQRSKPASKEMMAIRLENLIDNHELEQAKIVHNKIRHFYPEYQFDSELANKVSRNKLD